MGEGEGSTWTITELAREFGVTLRTIRFYEEQGLLSPAREGSQRVFGDGDRVRLKLVLRGKRLGFSLTEIKKIVGMYDTDLGEAGQLEYLLHQIAQRRAELKARLRDIQAILTEFDELERRCQADLRQLATDATP